jgi:hypothetical protein
MWESLKNLLVGATDALGIELPGLPVDLGSLGESASTAVSSVAESVTGATEALAPLSDQLAGGVADLGQAASQLPTDAFDAASAALPSLPDLTADGAAAR